MSGMAVDKPYGPVVLRARVFVGLILSAFIILILPRAKMFELIRWLGDKLGRFGT